MLSHRWYWLVGMMMVSSVLTVSCVATPTAQPGIPAQPAEPTPVPATATPVPATSTLVPATATHVPAETPSSESSETVNLEEILPGRPGELVFNNCTGCHSIVCSVIGQRTIEQWETVKRGHRDKVPGVSDEDYDLLFTFLEDNFNNTKPEPALPQRLLDLGCVTY
jgi:hypothetical protein